MRETFLDKKDNKNSLLKKTILYLCIEHGEHSIASISEAIGASVPTATKLIGELMSEGFMIDLGKSGTSGGRRPSIYGLNPEAGYFVGVAIRNKHASIAVTDFKGGLIHFKDDIPFVMEANESTIHLMSSTIREYLDKVDVDWNKIMGLGLSIPGRVNPVTGYSNTFSFDEHRPISQILEEDLNVHVVLENDSRAMTYGEYLGGGLKEKNMLFVNVSWGLGMGMILDLRVQRRVRPFPSPGQRSDLPLRKDRLPGDGRLRIGPGAPHRRKPGRRTRLFPRCQIQGRRQGEPERYPERRQERRYAGH